MDKPYFVVKYEDGDYCVRVYQNGKLKYFNSYSRHRYAVQTGKRVVKKIEKENK
jgi:hypothetical protein